MWNICYTNFVNLLSLIIILYYIDILKNDKKEINKIVLNYCYTI